MLSVMMSRSPIIYIRFYFYCSYPFPWSCLILFYLAINFLLEIILICHQLKQWSSMKSASTVLSQLSIYSWWIYWMPCTQPNDWRKQRSSFMIINTVRKDTNFSISIIEDKWIRRFQNCAQNRIANKNFRHPIQWNGNCKMKWLQRFCNWTHR